MRKTSVYLESDQVERLRRLAAAQGRSQAEVLREAIDWYAEHVERSRDFALAGVAEGPGDSFADISEAESLRGFGA